ncbi:MAG TPA: metallophosphoesterase [Candidatus Udaeobacter sp.]|nr:metallophosphoesterase [Candidatus Udaeobacter sp.]
MFTLAHLSDVHLGDVGIPSPGALLSKRFLGFLSWHLRRKSIHIAPVLNALVADLRARQADHIAVTGDLVNISLPGEFERADTWLATLGSPGDVTVIPGNHDAYVPIAWKLSLGLWAAYMAGLGPDGAETPAAGLSDFPFLRRRGPLALIGISTAEPMPPHMAAGRIGQQQLARLATVLKTSRDQSLCRVVLIHHPPVSDPAYKLKQLLDSEEFLAVIASEGAELILHGHTHMSGLTYLPTPAGRVPVVSVPSASAKPTQHHDPARYHLYRIERQGGVWRIDVEVRGIAPGLDRFVEERGFVLEVPAT